MSSDQNDKIKKIFHESWYRIAEQHVCLKASVRVHRQFYRGRKWYVLYNPLTNEYYKLLPSAYDFLVRLNLKQSIEEVWQAAVKQDPDNAPGQGEVIEILAQLYHANLLHYDMAKDSVKLFERYKKRKDQKVKMTLMNILFLRIPLFDPESILKKMMFWVNILMSKAGALLWFIVIGTGLKFVVDTFDVIKDTSEGILAPSNLLYLYVGMVLVKLVHELGHSFAVKRFGGEVHTIGLMFLLLMPLPYMDATASYSFRNKWKRVLVSSSGMMFEFFIAAIAVIIWANTGESSLRSLLYNIFFIASISTFLFNANPLLRYDGYYILTDLLDIPNLHQKSKEYLTYLLEYYVFKKKDSLSPAINHKDALLFSVFGIASNVYRITLFSGILIAISKKFLLLSVVMSIILFVSWIIIPVIHFHTYIFTNPKLSRVRNRVIGTYITFIACLVVVLGYIPFPYYFKAPGVLEGKVYKVITNKCSGKIDSITVATGLNVITGDTLVTLSNRTLEFEIVETEANLQEAQRNYLNAMAENPVDIVPFKKKIEVFQEKLTTLKRRQEELTVKSPLNGVWVSPWVNNLKGKWAQRGDSLGIVIDTSSFVFIAVVSQAEISNYYSQLTSSPEVKIKGQASIEIPVDSVYSVPMEHTELPSAALGWYGGGEIEVTQTDDKKTAVEPFYILYAYLSELPFKNKNKVTKLHGRTGKIKFSMGMKPLFWQIWHKLRQLIQKHYHV